MELHIACLTLDYKFCVKIVVDFFNELWHVLLELPPLYEVSKQEEKDNKEILVKKRYAYH